MKKLLKKTVEILLVLITAFYTLAACVHDNEKNSKLEYGFAEGSNPGWKYKAAIKSDESIFNIDDVTIEFYYGFPISARSIEEELELSSFPNGFDIYVANSEREVLYRHEEQNFVSEEYGCTIIYDEDFNEFRYEFNHCEKVTVPKEMFVDDEGYISFYVRGFDIKRNDPEITVVSIQFYYRVENSKVVLYDNYNKWLKECNHGK